MKGEIAKLLLTIKAIDIDTEKGFSYASGRKGPIYCDNRIVLSYQKERDSIIGNFLKLIEEKNLKFDIIAGVATGAIAWASILADRLKKPLVYIRASVKDHGKGNQIEGELQEGKKVLVIEDLVNTGGSSAAACEAVREESCDVAACIAIFNYGFDDAGMEFTKAKIPLYSLSDFNALIKAAAGMKYINADERKALLDWQKKPKEWKPYSPI